LSWLTTKEARELLENNLNIDDVWTNFSDATGFLFDRIFCLEEDQAVVDAASTLNTRTFTGAVPDGKGSVGYTTDAAAWFDMSAISQFGRERADELKKSNRKGHAEIFKAVFGVESVRPELPGVPLGSEAQALRDEFPRLIGINRGAGDRWPSKTLEEKEPAPLIRQILEAAPEGGTGVVLLGAGRLATGTSRLPVSFGTVASASRTPPTR